MTKQERYMGRLCDRIMGVASACRTSFDKHDITKRLGFKSTHNMPKFPSERFGVTCRVEKW